MYFEIIPKSLLHYSVPAFENSFPELNKFSFDYMASLNWIRSVWPLLRIIDRPELASLAKLYWISCLSIDRLNRRTRTKEKSFGFKNLKLYARLHKIYANAAQLFYNLLLTLFPIVCLAHVANDTVEGDVKSSLVQITMMFILYCINWGENFTLMLIYKVCFVFCSNFWLVIISPKRVMWNKVLNLRVAWDGIRKLLESHCALLLAPGFSTESFITIKDCNIQDWFIRSDQ